MPKLAVPKKSCVTERHRSQTGLIVVCFSRSMNGSGSRPSSSPSLRRNSVVDSRPIGACRYGPLERLAQAATELAVHADVDRRVRQPLDVGKVTAEREDHADLGADALDQAADLGEVARQVEAAVAAAR